MHDRKRDRLAGYGTPSTVSAIPTQRRLSALMAMGWPLSWLAQDLGFTQQGMSELFNNQQGTTRDTERKVADLFVKLWSVYPEGKTTGERMAISRAKSQAAARGFEPPLAWDEHEFDQPFEIELEAA